MEVNIPDLITHPEKLADRQLLQQLQTLSAKYPYYQTLYLLYLKGLYLLHDTRFGEELRRASLFVANRKVLFSLIEGDYYTLKPIVRKAKLQEKNNNQPVDRTLSLIDAFLNGLPPEPLEEEPFNDERLSNDYTTYVLREEDFDNQENEQGTSTPVTPAIPMKGQELIDQFIKKADREYISRKPIPKLRLAAQNLPLTSFISWKRARFLANIITRLTMPTEQSA